MKNPGKRTANSAIGDKQQELVCHHIKNKSVCRNVRRRVIAARGRDNT
jgi:hypothetical protein